MPFTKAVPYLFSFYKSSALFIFLLQKQCPIYFPFTKAVPYLFSIFIFYIKVAIEDLLD
jgi:hypothetical protein